MITLNVFCNEKGEFGNPVGIVEDFGKKINNQKRQEMARESGFSEIVFINDLKNKEVSIFSPTREIPFAGHALVGVAYYLSKELGKDIKQIKSMGRTIQAFQKDDQ